MTGLKLGELWYQPLRLSWSSLIVLPLWIVSLIYRSLVFLRRQAYQLGLLKSWRSPVPVVVVGNISAGGTGKTPLVIALIELLRAEGWSPGVVSRGYGGEEHAVPLLVGEDTAAHEAGDEPVLIVRRTGAPLCVFPDRSRAVKLLLDRVDIDIVVCDDGLQHYALERDIEIAVVDRTRGHGNGLHLPAGPLREPVSRLQSVDFTVYNAPVDGKDCYCSSVREVVRLDRGERRPLHTFAHQACHAVAGIGHPKRFFGVLNAAEITVIAHAFPDHHRYVEADLDFPDDKPVIMTEKDAVKCSALALDLQRCWSTEQQVSLADSFVSRFLETVSTLR